MSFDMNDAEPQKSGDLIADGSFAKVIMTIRPGGVDGDSEIDRGLLKTSGTPGSDVKMLDAEFTVAEGPYARRKFWQVLTVSGGKLDDAGVSIGWKISKSTIRAMIDSALGLDPKDMSEAAKAKRVLRGLADLAGISFVAKIKVEASSNGRYGDSNKLDHVVVPTEPEWRKVMDGEVVPPAPGPKSRPKPALAVVAKPAWGQPAPAGVFRGLAQTMGYGSYVAACAEVSVSAQGVLKVLRIVAATDPGYAVNPQQIEAQVEGSFAYGLSAALYGSCTVKDGRIEQTNFHTYPVLKMEDMPKVETVLVSSGGFWGGVGEPTIAVAAPAVLNAIFAATGRRIRDLPLKDQNLKRA